MKIQLHLKSYHAYYLNKLLYQLQKILNKFTYKYENQIFLPLKIEKYTILRSPHADKKARDQFERITHKRLLTLNFITFNNSNVLLIERLLRLLQPMAVGVEMRISYITKL